MINDIFILDDLIDKGRQDAIEDLMLGPSIDWQFISDVALPPNELKESKLNPTPAFGVCFTDSLRKYHNARLYNETSFIAFAATRRINFAVNDIINARSFLQLPLNDKIRKPFNNIHIDQKFDHLVCLYYVNDSDGDTHIFEGMYKEGSYLTEAKILKKVSPKKGRVVLFNGLRYHSSSCPTISTRCIINFNII